ncbi:MAG: cyclic nucleotide-binding domain-containing protein [Gammaproteobacteria bacterium]|nr:cyclic nucleotide-binding domain-containing protein [Gammaproteobacteria bacterium]
MNPYVAHVGYVFQLCALLVRDILWLRCLLGGGQVILSAYAYSRGVFPIAFWNAVFVGINSAWVVRILRERREVRIPPELVPIYEQHFAALSPPEFLRLWSWGESGKAHDAQLVRQNERPGTLYFVLAGEASVRADGREVARVRPGQFLAEMSLLTGEPTTADVFALGEIEYRVWPAERLRELRRDKPVLWTKIQSVLGHDLVEKIRISTARPATSST